MPKDISRVSTGVPGLDELIGGGLIENSVTLITGNAGTGKTIMSTQFLVEGLKKGETCMFISFEEKPQKIRESASDFGWDLEKYEDEGKLFLEHRDPFMASDRDEIFWFENKLRDKDIDRVALDSTSVVSLYFEDKYDIRKNTFKLTNVLQEANVTTMMTTESPEGAGRITRFSVEEFLVDGVLVLYYSQMRDKEVVNLQVRKMRRTDIDRAYHHLRFTDQGLEIGEREMSEARDVQLHHHRHDHQNQ